MLAIINQQKIHLVLQSKHNSNNLYSILSNQPDTRYIILPLNGSVTSARPRYEKVWGKMTRNKPYIDKIIINGLRMDGSNFKNNTKNTDYHNRSDNETRNGLKEHTKPINKVYKSLIHVNSL